MTEQDKQSADKTKAQQEQQPHSQLVEVSQEKAVSSDGAVDYSGWFNHFRKWLSKTGDNEVANLADFFDRSKKWWGAATELTADELAQASTYLKRDLAMFYRQYEKEFDNSEYIQSIKESVWQELAELTDKSQIEWQELKKDFDHDGIYHAGEWIGMGNIVCQSCHYKLEFNHPETLAPCPQCGNTTFIREALAP